MTIVSVHDPMLLLGHDDGVNGDHPTKIAMITDDDDPSLPRPQRRRRRHSISRALLLLSFLTIISLLLIGHVIYPSSPLLLPSIASLPAFDKNNGTSCHRSNAANTNDTPSDQCTTTSSTNIDNNFHCYYYHTRFKLSIATISFAIATSTRTILLAPLVRCHCKVDKLESVACNLDKFAHDVWEDVARRQSILWNEDDNEININSNSNSNSNNNTQRTTTTHHLPPTKMCTTINLRGRTCTPNQ
mmetsp:Transcript_27412/g.58902  ORF Transcript_27412/g.58902 Transcript_27412/m.58902 type:complete len:244 (-) Transcript_27412:487-1218(-)